MVTSDIDALTGSYANELRTAILDNSLVGLSTALGVSITEFTVHIADDSDMSDCNRALIATSWPANSYLSRSWGSDVATTCPLPPPSNPLPVPLPPEPPFSPPSVPGPRPPPPPPKTEQAVMTLSTFFGMGGAAVGACLIAAFFLFCGSGRNKREQGKRGRGGRSTRPVRV